MLIKIGSEIAFTFPQPVAMILMLYLHPSVLPKVRKTERLQVDPSVGISEYTDLYGNHCGRVFVQPDQRAFEKRGQRQVDEAYPSGF